MHAAHGRNRILKIPDAADEITVLHVVELQIGAGLNQQQIAHLPHPPTCKEATRSSLQPHCRRHLAAKHLPCQLRRHRLLGLLRHLALISDLLEAGTPIEDPIGEWVLDGWYTGEDNSASGGYWSDRRRGRRGACHRVHQPHRQC